MRQSIVVIVRRMERKSHAECGTELLKVKKINKSNTLCRLSLLFVCSWPKCDLFNVNWQAFIYIPKCFLKTCDCSGKQICDGTRWEKVNSGKHFTVHDWNLNLDCDMNIIINHNILQVSVIRLFKAVEFSLQLLIHFSSKQSCQIFFHS